ncbi:hypothetical protein IAQ61_000832 [Plenodomus lingam]|uniref:uncharacterized protein n=1 Tax=Leptosphaeria maculans TaxID=5022 RepID=UPI0033284776|nr:hypothetical protein IAQ61_000832 [Plenodomus lingam]
MDSAPGTWRTDAWSESARLDVSHDRASPDSRNGSLVQVTWWAGAPDLLVSKASNGARAGGRSPARWLSVKAASPRIACAALEGVDTEEDLVPIVGPGPGGSVQPETP